MVVVPYIKGYLSGRDEKAFLSLADDLEQDYPGHNIIFLALVGSHSVREPDENSDIDVFVVIDQLEKWKHGKTRREGVELEYFIYSPEMVLKKIKEEGEYIPITAHMLHKAKYLLYNAEKMDKILTRVEEIMLHPTQELSEEDREYYKHRISELANDLRDTLDDLAEYLVRSDLINISIEIFLKSHRVWKDRVKDIYEQLENMDPYFTRLIKNSIVPRSSIGELLDFLEDLLGGESKEWVQEGDY